MQSTAIALIVLACMFGGACLGMLLRLKLPDGHFSGGAKDVLKLGTGQTCVSYTDFRWLATRYGAWHDDVCLFTDMAAMIDGIVRKAGSPP